MDNIELAVAIMLGNLIVALLMVSWCNKKTKEFTDKDKWK